MHPSETAKPATGETSPAPPCTLVIFGAAGDLTKRLLMPALYNLAGAGLLDPGFQILGVDHNESSDEALRRDLTQTMESFTKDRSGEFHPDHIDDETWGFVCARIRFQKGDFEDPESYAALKERLTGNVVFYLAVSARYFGAVVEGLGKAGLLKESGDAFRRVVIEKPFGSDLASAKALNARILKQGDERQFYRIDHFLGKETVQSILAVRFANTMLEPVWRRAFVDHVEITAAETIGVEARGRFYEATGALCDMVPNHLFQILAMIGMEPPKSLDAEDIRDAKAALIAAVRPADPGEAARGQYAAGTVRGKAAAGYREEADVAKDSRVETYAALKLTIENERWSGVPFYLRTGKRLGTRLTEVAIRFKPTTLPLFHADGVGPAPGNVMRLMIDPEQGIRTGFTVKRPGPRMLLGQAETHFAYGEAFKEAPSVGYETLLYDCMTGDATLFQRADAIEGGWAAVEPLLEAWKSGEPESYPAGSEGPPSAAHLVERDGRAWLRLDDEA